MKFGLVVWVIMLADPSYANKRGAFCPVVNTTILRCKITKKIPNIQIYAEISTKNALFCVNV